jgi:cell division protein FtsX
MTTSILVHSILGTILTIAILLTAYNLVRMVLAPQEQKQAFTLGFRRSAIWTVALFIIYFLWILAKRML